MTTARAPLALRPRPGVGLHPAGCFATGALAEALVDALLVLDDARLAALRGVRASAGVVVVIGADELLPWLDGLRYLGEAAPGLYVPTTRETTVPAALAAAALRRDLPAALIDDVVVPLANARPLSRAGILRALERPDGASREPA